MPSLPLATPREYVCPGEAYAISHAVHRARQAAVYPKCRGCPLNDELPQPSGDTAPTTGGVRRLVKTDGLRGVYRNELDSSVAERLAMALARLLWEDALTAGGKAPARGFPVVVAYDDRPWSLPLAAAAATLLRRAGCETIDIGLATAPAFRFAVAHLDAAAGVFATGAGGGPAAVGFDFALTGGRPLSSGTSLDRLVEIADRGVNRLTRAAGRRREFDASLPYEAGLRRHFRPAGSPTVVIGTSSALLPSRLERLSAELPAKLRLVDLPRRPLTTETDQLAVEQIGSAVRESRAEFGLWIDESADACRLLDEAGHVVSVAAFAALLLRDAVNERPGSALSLDWPLAEALEGRATRSDIAKGNGTAEAMFLSMADHTPAAGFDSAGRFWLPGPPPACDPLVTLARLIRIVVASDGPISALVRHPS